MSRVVETRKLGLAAFIKMNGGRLTEMNQETNAFVFTLPENNTKTVEDWEFMYVNSCCHRHDTELVNLRKLIRR